MSDDRLDERIEEAAQGYNPPPETPREAMWSRISAARADPAGRAAPPAGPGAPVPPLALVSLAAAAAAVLAVGIGIGGCR